MSLKLNLTTQQHDKVFKEDLPNLCKVASKKARKCWSFNTVKGYFPFLVWLPKYQLNYLISDLVAGLTVGLTTVPQAIAYGTIAGLPPQYGLYSAFMGCFVYIIFGTCKDLTIGPTAIMSLMVQTHVSDGPAFAILSCFLSGCVITTMGLLNLGVLVQFISLPVSTGFTTAAAITIASGQINSLFGISSPSNEFLASWENLFTHLNEAKLNDSLLGVGTLILLLLLRKVKDLPCGWKTLTNYITLCRNIIAVILGMMLCYFLKDGVNLPFRVTGEITPGIPQFTVPPFSTTVDGNELNFSDMLSILGTSLFTIPLVSLIEAVAITKAFNKGRIVDNSQEMIALGLSNISSSFFQSMPITSSFARTAINNSSGVKTQLGGAVTGTLVLMTLAWLTTTFYYIPKASLAALIIAAMIFMIEIDRILEIWRSKKIDFVLYAITVILCLFLSLEQGIVCGIVINLFFIIYKSARPTINVSSMKIENSYEIVIVKVLENLCYTSAEYLKAKVVKFVTTQGNLHTVVIMGDEITSIDSTVATNILSLREDLSVMGCDLVCWNWNRNAAGVIYRIHHNEHNFFKYGKNISELFEKSSNNDNTVLPIN